MYDATITPKDAKIDWLMLGAIAGLMLVGVAFIYSATTTAEMSSRFWLKQAIFYGGGIAVAVAICFIPYETISRFAVVGYCFSIVLLVVVMFFGKTVGGATRWIDLGFFRIQPSEFAKIGVIFMLASFLSRSQEELRDPKLFFKTLGLIGLPFCFGR